MHRLASKRLRPAGDWRRRFHSAFSSTSRARAPNLLAGPPWLLSAFEFPQRTNHVDNVRCLAMKASAVETDWKEKARSFLREHLPREAQNVLEQQEYMTTATGEQDRREIIGEILDGWIDLQNRLVEAYDVNKPDRSKLKNICEAAEEAHRLLERMIPSLVSHIAANEYEDEPQRVQYHDFDTVATARCEAVLNAWVAAVRQGHSLRQTSLTRGIPQRAHSLLEQMEQSYANQIVASELSVRPSVESYNRVMEAWAYSHELIRGSMAERIFQKLSNGTVSGSRPNNESYKLIIRAWSLSGERKAAFSATGHLQQMLQRLEQGDEDMEPALEDYRVVLKAWTRVKSKSAPGNAMTVLRLMDDALENGTTVIQPDYDCFRYVLRTVLRTSEWQRRLPHLEVHVDDVLRRMSRRLMIPDTECYSAAIQVWKNSALNPNMIESRDRSVSRTLELFAEMKVAHNQSSTVSVALTTEVVNSVIQALSVFSDQRRMELAEKLLFEMEEALANGLGPKPNPESYIRVMEVWGSCMFPDKVPRAKAILWRMEEKYDELKAATAEKDAFVDVFNAFIKICAHTEATTERAAEILRDALAASGSIRKYSGLKPNSQTYVRVVYACKHLLPPGKDREAAIDKVFRLCCHDGLVNHSVLKSVRSSATEEHYSRLVISASEDVEGTLVVPEAWTVNVLGDRVHTPDGRKTKPLSVKGKLEMTTAMEDFRMRRMRDKRNRKLLRGGRLPRPKDIGDRKPISAEDI